MCHSLVSILCVHANRSGTLVSCGAKQHLFIIGVGACVCLLEALLPGGILDDLLCPDVSQAEAGGKEDIFVSLASGRSFCRPTIGVATS